jgi:glycosyltransferase involved in cell wall biosynthesis
MPAGEFFVANCRTVFETRPAASRLLLLMHIPSEVYKLASGEGGVDRAWYLQKYPEVAAAGVDPVEHYLRYGCSEGRDPRLDFSTSGYLEANSGVEGNPLVHYLKQGGTKVPSADWQFAEDYKLASGEGGVDRAWYLQKYLEVAAAGVDPVEHYLRYGCSEGRDPRLDFSTSGYLEANSGVEGNPLVHYLKHGGTKVPSADWRFAEDYKLASGVGGVDRAWYLQKYPEVAAAGVDPVEHYLRYGRDERRDPRPDFSTAAYLEAHKAITGNPLVHYLRRVRAPRREESATTEWHRLWEKGYLYPKGGQPPSASATFGTPNVPKILFTGHEASRTGAPLVLLNLMQAMQRLTGAEFYLILERGGALLEDFAQIAHVFVNHNGMLHLSNGQILARMLGTIASPAPALSICNSADGWRLIKAVREAGLPHTVSILHERGIHFTPDVWRTIHQCSDRVIFPSEAVKLAAIAVLPDFHDAAVVRHGLLNPIFGQRDRNIARADVRNKLGLAPDTAIVLGCGTRDLRKGIDLFVQLAAHVRARATRKVHFLWLGAEQYGAYFERFIALDISELKLTSTVSLLGEVTDPEPYFLAADAFALTSRDDPFPCVIHEAMACALPIVVFDGAGGAKEAIEGDCGVVVPYLDVPAMTDALLGFVDHPAQSAAMGQRAEARVRSTYRFLDYADQISRICEEVSKQRAEPRRVEPDPHAPSEDRSMGSRTGPGDTAPAVQAATVPLPNLAGPVNSPTTVGRVNAAIASAVAFLKQRLRTGDYALACRNAYGQPVLHHGTGHVFVAFFISEAMLGLLDENERALILVRILSEEYDGGWGYSRAYDLADADDTAFVFRTLKLLGAGRTPQCLMRFYREDAGMFAWVDVPGPIALTLERSMENNFQAQPEVNANVFLALRGTPFEEAINYDFLLQWQQDDGHFPSYFYPSKLHATLMMIDLLRGKSVYAAATRRALSFVAQSQHSDGSWGAGGDPYETALAVTALAGQDAYAPVVRRGVEHLLASMAADGSWRSKTAIWEWLGADGLWSGYDEDRAFVTACCLTALRRAAGHFAGSPSSALWKWTPSYQIFADAVGIQS